MIHEAIICMYETLVRQIQEIIKPLIVPAILCHDEITRARNKRALSTESPKSAGPQSLVDQLEQIYKQFEFYGLHNCYREQIFQQLFYFVCAVALNNLMLRRDLCTWKTGVNLRHNVGCLESWITKEKKMVFINLRLSSLDFEKFCFFYSQKPCALHRHPLQKLLNCCNHESQTMTSTTFAKSVLR